MVDRVFNPATDEPTYEYDAKGKPIHDMEVLHPFKANPFNGLRGGMCRGMSIATFPHSQSAQLA